MTEFGAKSSRFPPGAAGPGAAETFWAAAGLAKRFTTMMSVFVAAALAGLAHAAPYITNGDFKSLTGGPGQLGYNTAAAWPQPQPETITAAALGWERGRLIRPEAALANCRVGAVRDKKASHIALDSLCSRDFLRNPPPTFRITL